MDIHAKKKTSWPPRPPQVQNFHILTESLELAKLDVNYTDEPAVYIGLRKYNDHQKVVSVQPLTLLHLTTPPSLHVFLM